jgi:hypothetical protein
MGDRFELTEDGFEKLILQKDEKGIFQHAGYTGLIYPEPTLRPYLLRIYKEGVDDNDLIPGTKRAYTNSDLGDVDERLWDEFGITDGIREY